MQEADGVSIHNYETKEFTWTIEKGEEPVITGDLNGDGNVDIADAVGVLGAMANGSTEAIYDVNGDGNVDIADFVAILEIMAGA